MENFLCLLSLKRRASQQIEKTIAKRETSRKMGVARSPLSIYTSKINQLLVLLPHPYSPLCHLKNSNNFVVQIFSWLQSFMILVLAKLYHSLFPKEVLSSPSTVTLLMCLLLQGIMSSIFYLNNSAFVWQVKNSKTTSSGSLVLNHLFWSSQQS